MTDVEKAKRAMSFVDQSQVLHDEDIFKLAGTCKYYGESLKEEFFSLSLGHPKKHKFEEKWKNTKPYKSPGMIFNLAMVNGYKNCSETHKAAVSTDVSIYETLHPIDEDCLSYYQSRCLSVYPETARKSFFKGETSIWLPYKEIGGKKVIGIHKTYFNRKESRKVFSKGAQPQAGIVAYLGKIGQSSDIHIAEGVETLLSPMSAGIEGKFYACLNCSNLKKFKALGQGRLFIWADNDENNAGKIAATRAAKQNGQSRQCFIIFPPAEEIDWNDILMLDGVYSLIKAFKACKPYFDRRRNNPGRPTADYMKLAEDFIKQWTQNGVVTLRNYRGQYYSFDGQAYKPYNSVESDIMEFLQCTKKEQDKEISRLQKLSEAGQKSESDQEKLEALEKVKVPLTEAAIRNIKANLQSYRHCSIPYEASNPCFLGVNDNFEGASQLIAFSNGLTIDVLKFVDMASSVDSSPNPDLAVSLTEPGIFQTNFVDYPLNLENKECPKFQKYLEGVQPSEKDREVLQMMLGLLLIPDTSYNVIFFLVGESGTGKSQFLEIIKGVLGERNTCSVQPHMMVERFQTKVLTEKLVNIVGDLAATSEGKTWSDYEGVLKDRSDGGLLSTEKKGCPHISSAPNSARDVFATNSMPFFADRSGGIWDRLRIFKFDVNFRDNKEEKVPHLGKQIVEEEASAIFLWALDGLVKLKRLHTFPEMESGLRSKQEHKKNCNPDKEYFLQTYTSSKIDSQKHFVSTMEFYHDYEVNVKSEGRRPKSMQNALKELLSAFPNASKERKRICKGENPQAVIFGINKRRDLSHL